MPSSYSNSLRIEKQADGENETLWGQITNTNFELFEDSIAGVLNVTVASSNVTLTTNNGADDQARHMVLNLTGTLTANINIVFPDVEKVYLVRAAFTGAFTVTLKNTSGTGVTITAGQSGVLFTDGTETYWAVAPSATPDPVNVTGDMEPTLRSTAKSGWILLQGQTLGSASSSADLAGTTYQALYEFIWNNVSDTYAPVTTGRGASAAADFAANKRITIPDARDRALFGVGSTWALGQTQGEETFTLAETNLPAHTHAAGTLATASAGDHSHTVNIGSTTAFGTTTAQGSSSAVVAGTVSTSTAGAHTHTLTGSTASTGSGTAKSFLPKGLGVNWMIKL